MAIRIITDSTCDLPRTDEARLGIDIVPLSVIFDGKAYRDGVDMTSQEFYEKLGKAEVLPTTSQVAPADFEVLFRRYIQEGDSVIGIFLSSKISGTCQSAEIAKGLVEEGDIFIVDSKSTTFGLSILVHQAVSMRDAGLSPQSIVTELEFMAEHIRFLAVVDTLKYLKMGGRISAATAMVGGLLGINPIVGIVDGEVKALGKARGRGACYRQLLEMIAKDPPNYGYAFGFAHSNAPELLGECMDFFQGELPIAHTITGSIGCVIGTHAGPGAVGLAYIAKE